MEILTNLAIQLLLTVGILVAFGLLIALSRRLFCRITGRAGPRILLATGIVGTPVHELSHAVMCLLFGHRITEMRLFSFSGDGALGYVSHSYDPHNLYHRIGCFFIGIAPILGGSAVLLLLLSLLVPQGFSEVSALLLSPRGEGVLADYFSRFFGVLAAVLSPRHANEIGWWIFLLLALMIAGHMEISAADIRSGTEGFWFLAVLLLSLDTVLFFVDPEALTALTDLCTAASAFIVGFLALSGVFSLLLILLALLVRFVWTLTR